MNYYCFWKLIKVFNLFSVPPLVLKRCSSFTTNFTLVSTFIGEPFESINRKQFDVNCKYLSRCPGQNCYQNYWSEASMLSTVVKGERAD